MKNVIALLGLLALSVGLWGQQTVYPLLSMEKISASIKKNAAIEKWQPRDLLQEIYCIDEDEMTDESNMGLQPTSKTHYSLDETNGYYTMTIEKKQYNDSTGIYEPFLKGYVYMSSANAIDQISFYSLADSTITMAWDESINDFSIIFKGYNEFDGSGKLLSATTYLGSGLLFSKSLFYYTNGGFLIAETNYGFDFFSGGFVVEDSTVYENNVAGDILSSTTYLWDSNTHLFFADKKATYYYSNQTLDSIVTFTYEGMNLTPWQKEVYEFDSQDRVTYLLTQNILAGEWQDNSIDSFYFDGLNYNFPSREVHLVSDSGNWRPESVITRNTCTMVGMTSAKLLPFTARLDGNDLILTNIEGSGLVRIVDVSGNVLFAKQYDVIPNRIFVGSIQTGVYFVNIEKGQESSVQKLFAF
ncbi:MAG TPA: T9SS type A sorting domain-containing protein [Saprospiraceae bacterium]|nr:T9SS type A sorting domain-containing protein [Saprospiraceae bacterium]